MRYWIKRISISIAFTLYALCYKWICTESIRDVFFISLSILLLCLFSEIGHLILISIISWLMITMPFLKIICVVGSFMFLWSLLTHNVNEKISNDSFCARIDLVFSFTFFDKTKKEKKQNQICIPNVRIIIKTLMSVCCV